MSLCLGFFLWFGGRIKIILVFMCKVLNYFYLIKKDNECFLLF